MGALNSFCTKAHSEMVLISLDAVNRDYAKNILFSKKCAINNALLVRYSPAVGTEATTRRGLSGDCL